MPYPLIYFVASCALMGFALRMYYLSKKKEFPELKLQFRIIDFWATMIGTLPSMLMLTALKNAAEQETSVEAVLTTFGVVFPCQLAGCFFGIISNEVLGETSQQKPGHAMMNVIGGGIFGLLAAPVVLIALGTVVLIYEVIVWIYKTDVWILIALAFAITTIFSGVRYALKQRAREKKEKETTPAPLNPSAPDADSSGDLSGG